MYVVIFRAKVRVLDTQYLNMAQRMRQLAFDEFGCLDFSATSEGDEEIAVSYWRSLEDIQRWKAHAAHLQAQARGREQWYHSYQVDIAEIVRSYQHPAAEQHG